MKNCASLMSEHLNNLRTINLEQMSLSKIIMLEAEKKYLKNPNYYRKIGCMSNDCDLHFMEKHDKDPNLICFEININCLRDGQPEDYISLSTLFEYKELFSNTKGIFGTKN